MNSGKRRIQMKVLHTTQMVFWFRGCVDDGTESIPCINSESKHLPKKRSVDPPQKKETTRSDPHHLSKCHT